MLIEANICDESYTINHNSFRLCYLDFTLEDGFPMLPIQRKLPHHILDGNSWKIIQIMASYHFSKQQPVSVEGKVWFTGTLMMLRRGKIEKTPSPITFPSQWEMMIIVLYLHM